MNKKLFLERLEAGLAGLAPEERVAAMQYYIEYLDDAGPEREQEVLAELGSPDDVAAVIRAESEGDGWTPPEKKAEPVQQAPPPPQGAGAPYGAGGTPPPPPYYGPRDGAPPTGAAQQAAGYGQQSAGYGQQAAAAPKNNSKLILALLLIVFCSPLVFSLSSGVLGVLVGIVVTLACPLIVGVALSLAGIIVVVTGCAGLSIFFPTGLVTAGIGLVVLGLGLLCTYAGWWILTKPVPRLIRWVWGGIKNLWSKLFGKARA